MAAVMLAVYPEVSAGGAVMAGGPFRCATDAVDAQYRCMKGLTKHTPEQWGDLVRSVSDYIVTKLLFTFFKFQGVVHSKKM